MIELEMAAAALCRTQISGRAAHVPASNSNLAPDGYLHARAVSSMMRPGSKLAQLHWAVGHHGSATAKLQLTTDAPGTWFGPVLPPGAGRNMSS